MQEISKDIARLEPVATDLEDEQLIALLTEAFRVLPKQGTKVIALVGGPASGKGTLAASLQEALRSATVLSTDDYLRGDRQFRRTTIEDKGLDPILKYNFEFLDEQVQQIIALQEGQTFGLPQYDGTTGIAIGTDPDNPPETNTYKNKTGHVDYLIIEGDFQPIDRKDIDYLVYLDVPDEVRLANRIHRDLQERGESAEQAIIDNFNNRQRTQFLPHTLPIKAQADMILQVRAKPLEEPTADRKFEYRYNVHQRIPLA